MSKKIDAWECDVCKQAYFSEEDAKKCEDVHAMVLNVLDMRKYKPENRYPTFILIEDPRYGGECAEYRLEHVDSVEGFYNDGENYGKPRED